MGYGVGFCDELYKDRNKFLMIGMRFSCGSGFFLKIIKIGEGFGN